MPPVTFTLLERWVVTRLSSSGKVTGETCHDWLRKYAHIDNESLKAALKRKKFLSDILLFEEADVQL